MWQIEAIYRNGVFEPLEPVDLPDNQEVRLEIEVLGVDTTGKWIKKADELRGRLKAKSGTFPDSTQDIAEDRRR